MSTLPNPDLPPQEPVRPHTFDGIQEYDKRLPNWWLLTFYGAIVFSIGYWFYYSHTALPLEPGPQVEFEIARIQTAKLASADTLNDDGLWQMSRNQAFVTAGAATFKTNCASCHGEQLLGGVGPNLVDQTWIHGGSPLEVLNTVTNGVPLKGMQAWGPVLGPKRISAVVSYIMSKHEPMAAAASAQVKSQNPYLEQ